MRTRYKYVKFSVVACLFYTFATGIFALRPVSYNDILYAGPGIFGAAACV